MKIGILADIHEDLGHLRWAIDVLGEHGADRLVVLGDVFELGHRLGETIALLAEVGAIGVWGNHDFGLCRDNPRPEDRRRYGEGVLAFMGRLQPRLEVEGCLFTHVEPWLDPEKIEDLWYFDGPPETPEQVARIFASAPNRVMFVGHYHRWLLVTPEGLRPWSGDEPTVLEAGNRYLVAVHAVCAGRCALIDTETNELIPFHARPERAKDLRQDRNQGARPGRS
jgi:predicted phosphodiesterase